MESPVGALEAGVSRPLDCLMDELQEDELMMRVHDLLWDDVRRQEAEELGKQCLALQEPLTFDDAAIFFSEEEWKEWKELEGWFQSEVVNEFPSLQAVLAQDNLKNIKNTTDEDEPDAKLEANEELSHSDPATTPKPHLHEESLKNQGSSQKYEMQTTEISVENGPRTGNDTIENRHQQEYALGQNTNHTSDRAVNETDKEEEDQTTSQAGSWPDISLSNKTVIPSTTEQNCMTTSPDETNIETGTHCNAQTTADENIQKTSDCPSDNNRDIQQRDQPKTPYENDTDGEQQKLPDGHSDEKRFSYAAKTYIDVEKKDLSAQPLESSYEAEFHCNTTGDAIGVQEHQPTSPKGFHIEMDSRYNTVNENITEHNRPHHGESSENASIYFTVNDAAREQNDQSTPPEGNLLETRNTCASANDIPKKEKDELTPQTEECCKTSASSGTELGQINRLTPSSETNDSCRILNATPSQQKDIFTPHDEEKFEIRYYDITANDTAGEFITANDAAGEFITANDAAGEFITANDTAGELICQLTPTADNCNKTRSNYSAVNDTDGEQSEQGTPPEGIQQKENIPKILNYAATNKTERQQRDHLSITYEDSNKIVNDTADNDTNGEHKEHPTPSYRNENTSHYDNVDDTVGKHKLLIPHTGDDTSGEAKDPSVLSIWSSSEKRCRYATVAEDAVIQKHQPTPLTESWTAKSFSSYLVNSKSDQPTQPGGKGFTLRCCYGTENNTDEECPTGTTTSCSSAVDDAAVELRDPSAFSHKKCSENSNYYSNANNTTGEATCRPTQPEKIASERVFQSVVVNYTTEQQKKLPIYLGQNKSEQRPSCAADSECYKEKERQPALSSDRRGPETNLNHRDMDDSTQEQMIQPASPGLMSEESSIGTSVIYVSREQNDYPIQTDGNVLEESSLSKLLNDTAKEQKKHPNPPTVKSEQLRSSCISVDDTTGDQEELIEGKGSETMHSSSALKDIAKERNKMPASPAKDSLEPSKATGKTNRKLKDHPLSVGNNTVTSYSTEETADRATPLIVKWWGKGSSAKAVNAIAGDNKVRSRAPSSTVAEKFAHCVSVIATNKKQKKQPTPVENGQKKSYEYRAENDTVTEPKHKSTPHDKTMSTISPYYDTQVNNTEDNQDISPTPPTGKGLAKRISYTSANIPTGQQLADSAKKRPKKIYCDRAIKDSPDKQRVKSTSPVGKCSERRSSSRILNNASREGLYLFARKPSEKVSSFEAVHFNAGERSTSSKEKTSSYSSTKETNTMQSTNVRERSTSCRATSAKTGKEKHQSIHSFQKTSEKSNLCKTLNCTSREQDNPPIHSAGMCAPTKIIFRIVNKAEDQLAASPTENGLGNCKNNKLGKNATAEPKEPPKTKRYECGKCEESFEWKSMLVKHQRTHRMKVELQCRECGKTFTRKALLLQHEATHIKKVLLTCKECGQRFRTMQRLANHEAKHFGCGLFICMHCGIRFTQKRQLNQHRLTHAAEKGRSMLGDTSQVLSCDQCGATFRQESDLAQHLLTHNGKKTFACDNCDKIFPQKCDLFVHQLIHKGKKPFTCDQCGESFAEMFRLMQHKLTHPGKKSFTTWLCSLVQS